MSSPTTYSVGTASVANGDTTVTFSGAIMGSADFPNFRAGDLFAVPGQPLVPPQRLASVDYGAETAELWVGWPGATIIAAAYEVRFVDEGVRTTAQTRRYIEMLGQLSALGIQPNAFGLMADRPGYDDRAAGFIFLDVGDPWTLYIKLSATAGDWGAGQPIEGGEGPMGPAGLVGVWQGAYSGATAYVLKDVVLDDGSLWIAKGATTGNAPPVLPTTSNTWWDLLLPKGAKGDPGEGNVDGVAAGDGITVDGVTDPANPVVALSAGTLALLGLASTAVQPGSLGNAATRDVGTGAGTVAAGDDSRIVGGLQAATEDQTIVGGARVTVKNLGNLNGASITPDPGDRPVQKITNNGAGSILPGSDEGSYLLQVINASGAGAITTTGWTLKGDSFDTTSTSKFLCSCMVTSDIKVMSVLKVA